MAYLKNRNFSLQKIATFSYKFISNKTLGLILALLYANNFNCAVDKTTDINHTTNINHKKNCSNNSKNSY